MEHTATFPYHKWVSFWKSTAPTSYDSEYMIRMLEEEYSIVSWQSNLDQKIVKLVYTDEKLYTYFLLRWK